MKMGWFGFWIFLAVVWYCDHAMYLKGHDTLLFKHHTPEELRIREAQIKAYEQYKEKTDDVQ